MFDEHNKNAKSAVGKFQSPKSVSDQWKMERFLCPTWDPKNRWEKNQIKQKPIRLNQMQELGDNFYLFNNALFKSNWNCGGSAHYLYKWNGF